MQIYGNFEGIFLIIISSNYSDFTRVFTPNGGLVMFSKGNPSISVKSRFVKCYNARTMHCLDWCHIMTRSVGWVRLDGVVGPRRGKKKTHRWAIVCEEACFFLVSPIFLDSSLCFDCTIVNHHQNHHLGEYFGLFPSLEQAKSKFWSILWHGKNWDLLQISSRRILVLSLLVQVPEITEYFLVRFVRDALLYTPLKTSKRSALVCPGTCWTR